MSPARPQSTARSPVAKTSARADHPGRRRTRPMEAIACVRCGFDLVHHADGRGYRVTCPECGDDDAARLPSPKAGPWPPLIASLIATGLSMWCVLAPDFQDSVLVDAALAGLGGSLGAIATARAWAARPRYVIDIDPVVTSLLLPITAGWMLLIAWAVATHTLRTRW